MMEACFFLVGFVVRLIHNVVVSRENSRKEENDGED